MAYADRDTMIAAILKWAEECARRDQGRRTPEQIWKSWGSFKGDDGKTVEPQNLEKISEKWLFHMYKTGEQAFADATNHELNL